MAQKQRRIRPCVGQFDVAKLIAGWDKLASQRAPGFKWDCSTYSALSRQSLPDFKGLSAHAPALKVVLELSPSGFPAYSLVRSAIYDLCRMYNIFDNCPPKLQFKYAGEAADAWKILCRHVYELAKSGITTALVLRRHT